MLKWHSNSIVFGIEDNYLICEDEYLQPALTSLLYFGSLLGFFVIPYIADNYGRKLAIVISWSIFIFGISILSLANSVLMIGMGQLLSGFGINPAITLSYSFINEQCLGKNRQLYSIMIQISFAIGECMIAFIFLSTFDWRSILKIILIFSVGALLCLFYLVESPQFLVTKDRKKAL